MLVFDRYPLVDGSFFLSPKQHSTGCIEVSPMTPTREKTNSLKPPTVNFKKFENSFDRFLFIYFIFVVFSDYY